MIYTPNSPPANTNIGMVCFDPRFCYTPPVLYAKPILRPAIEYQIAFKMFGNQPVDLSDENPSELEEELVPSSSAD